MSDQKTEQKPEHEKRIREASNYALDNEWSYLVVGNADLRALLADLDAMRADVDALESSLEALVNRANYDANMSNDDAVIAAEATLERIYKARLAALKGASHE